MIRSPVAKSLPDRAPSEIVRWVFRPRPDGGAAFRVEAPLQGWAKPLRDLAERLRSAPGRLPSTVTVTNRDGVVMTGRVHKAGGGGVIDGVFTDEAQLRLMPDLGLASLVTKAHGLWTRGVEGWMTVWLDETSHLVLGKQCPDLVHRRRNALQHPTV